MMTVRERAVVDAAIAYVAEFRWMLESLIQIEHRGHDNEVRVAILRAVNALQDVSEPGEDEPERDEVDPARAKPERGDAPADHGHDPQQEVHGHRHADRVTPGGRCSHGVPWSDMPFEHWWKEHGGWPGDP